MSNGEVNEFVQLTKLIVKMCQGVGRLCLLTCVIAVAFAMDTHWLWLSGLALFLAGGAIACYGLSVTFIMAGKPPKEVKS